MFNEIESIFSPEIKSIAINTILFVVFICVLFVSYSIYHKISPKEVTIDSTKFACTAAEPNGIETRCTQYSMNRGIK